MRVAMLALVVVPLACAGTGVEGQVYRAPRGPWGAGGEGPARYVDWSLGVGYSMKNWADRGVDESAWFPMYDVSFIYHFTYSWDVEFSTWFGRFEQPQRTLKIQSIVHVLSLRWTRPVGLGWVHLSGGAGICDNDNTDTEDALALKFALGYTYPLPWRLNFSANAGYIVNETHFIGQAPWEYIAGEPISLSVPFASVSLATTF